jgi:hypothetical protein
MDRYSHVNTTDSYYKEYVERINNSTTRKETLAIQEEFRQHYGVFVPKKTGLSLEWKLCIGVFATLGLMFGGLVVTTEVMEAHRNITAQVQNK